MTFGQLCAFILFIQPSSGRSGSRRYLCLYLLIAGYQHLIRFLLSQGLMSARFEHGSADQQNVTMTIYRHLPLAGPSGPFCRSVCQRTICVTPWRKRPARKGTGHRHAELPRAENLIVQVGSRRKRRRTMSLGRASCILSVGKVDHHHPNSASGGHRVWER